MKKTIEEVLKEALTPLEFEQAMTAMRLEGNGFEYSPAHSFGAKRILAQAFSWNDSLEGHEYWSEIHKCLN